VCVSHVGGGQHAAITDRLVPATPNTAMPNPRVSLPHVARNPRRDNRRSTIVTAFSASSVMVLSLSEQPTRATAVASSGYRSAYQICLLGRHPNAAALRLPQAVKGVLESDEVVRHRSHRDRAFGADGEHERSP